MRDISSKPNTLRTAKARAILKVSPATLEAIRTGNLPKADPLAVARVAGIQAAKNTSVLIPYCHQVPLDYVGIEITTGSDTITITSEVSAIWKTGVEMEALVGASAVALTLYDMLKAIDEKMEILSTTLLEKKGGKSSLRETGNGLTAAVLVLSDTVSRDAEKDRSGSVLAERLKPFGITISRLMILPDDCAVIEHELKELSDKEKIDLIVTTGGTGVGPRDVTAEATLRVIDKRLEGVEETLRSYGQDRIPTAMLSRAVVGIRAATLIINLPGSPSGVEDGISAIFPAVLHVFQMFKGMRH